MDTFVLFAYLFFSVIILVFSAKLVESAFVHVSHKLKINEFFLGFVVLGIITSLPEITIAALSSIEIPQLSLGNLIGATIVVLCLILGMSAVKYKEISFKGRFSEKEVFYGLITFAVMIIVLLDANITIIDSFILLGAYSLFVFHLYRKFGTKRAAQKLFLKLENANPIKIFLTGVVGIVALLISSSFIVSTAEQIANNLGIAASLIGIIFLAIGTNLPEITILIISKNREEEDLAIGNFFGSACVNVAILGLLGLTSQGFVITSFSTIIISMVILTLAVVFFAIFSWTGRKLSWREGILLVSLYVSFVIAELIALSSL
jgi:cation:H+ antiporter